METVAWNKEELIRGLESGKLLPSLSPLTMRLIELASEETSSLGDIASLIERDPSLTIRVLKLANSVFFRYGNPAKTVRQAVVRIGIRQTRLLALSLLLKDTFPLRKVGAADYRRFWRLSLYQGLIAQSLAQELKIGDREEAFTAGFTLEIGFLVLLHVFLDHRNDPAEIPWYPLSQLLEWEKENYGMHHREIGEFILTYWKFPASFILCQKSSALIRKVDGLLPLVRVCAMASQLSAFICEPEARLSEVFDTLEYGFALPRALIHEVVTRTLQQVDEVGQTFEVEVDSKRDTEALMEKARAVLAHLSGKLREGHPSSVAGPPSPASLSEPGDDGAKAVAPALESIEHEIRDPLTVVGGLVRMLARTIDPASDQGRYIKVILAETERLEQALKGIEQILDR
jgi:HD-like signal output (HDOD) protein